jgi:hypothetical protein
MKPAKNILIPSLTPKGIVTTPYAPYILIISSKQEEVRKIIDKLIQRRVSSYDKSKGILKEHGLI